MVLLFLSPRPNFTPPSLPHFSCTRPQHSDHGPTWRRESQTITLNGAGFTNPTAFKHFVEVYGSSAIFAGHAVASLYDSSGLVSRLKVPAASYSSSNKFWKTWTINIHGNVVTHNKLVGTKAEASA